MLEEKKKLEQQIKYKQYMVDIGLIPQSELDKFIQAKERKTKRQDVVKFSQTHYTKNTALFAFLTLNSGGNLPKSGAIDQQIIANLLDAGYYYWEFFIRTKNMKHAAEDMGEFKFALISLSFYAAADHYIYFMQLVTKQLPQKSIERKLLLILLDGYYYNKCGHSLEASTNILKFVELGLGSQIQLHSFYFMTLIEQALMILLSS